jgi:hypothetical protein
MWTSYLEMVTYPNIKLDPIQIREMRRAFYAGFWGMLTEPDPSSAAIAAWVEESRAFKLAVLRGKA